MSSFGFPTEFPIAGFLEAAASAAQQRRRHVDFARQRALDMEFLKAQQEQRDAHTESVNELFFGQGGLVETEQAAMGDRVAAIEEGRLQTRERLTTINAAARDRRRELMLGSLQRAGQSIRAAQQPPPIAPPDPSRPLVSPTAGVLNEAVTGGPRRGGFAIGRRKPVVPPLVQALEQFKGRMDDARFNALKTLAEKDMFTGNQLIEQVEDAIREGTIHPVDTLRREQEIARLEQQLVEIDPVDDPGGRLREAMSTLIIQRRKAMEKLRTQAPFNPVSSGRSFATTLPGRAPTREEAMAILREAGGDPQVAAQLARTRGFVID